MSKPLLASVIALLTIYATTDVRKASASHTLAWKAGVHWVDQNPSADYFIAVHRPGTWNAEGTYRWAIEGTVMTGVESPGMTTADEGRDNPWIKSISPNPARNTFSVRGLVPSSRSVRISLYTVGGRSVRRKEFTNLAPGEQDFRLEVGGLPAGVYFVRYEDLLTNGSFRTFDTAKIVLVR